MGFSRDGENAVDQTVDGVYRSESRRVLATLMNSGRRRACRPILAHGLSRPGGLKPLTRCGDAQGLIHRSKTSLSSRVAQCSIPNNGTRKASKMTGYG
jgi:hypothetical protein